MVLDQFCFVLLWHNHPCWNCCMGCLLPSTDSQTWLPTLFLPILIQLCRCLVAYRYTDEERKAIQLIPFDQSCPASLWQASKGLRTILLCRPRKEFRPWKGGVGCKRFFEFSRVTKAHLLSPPTHDEGTMSRRSATTNPQVPRSAREQSSSIASQPGLATFGESSIILGCVHMRDRESKTC